MKIFYDRDFSRIELRIPRGHWDKYPEKWWGIQDWFDKLGVISLSNKSAEYDEIRPLPSDVTNYVWWDCFDFTDRWVWYIPHAHKGLAALFKLTWMGQ